jgi:hypothetical protein
VGIDHDTAQFAVQAIGRWWHKMGGKRYPNASALLITADGGGSNGSRCRLWKVALQSLALSTVEIWRTTWPPPTDWGQAPEACRRREHCSGVERRLRRAVRASMRGGVLECAAKRLCSHVQSLVARPEFRPLGQRYRGQEVNIDIPDALTVQDMAFDEAQNFLALGDRGCRQILEQLQHRRMIAQTPTCDLADDERMHHDLRSFQKLGKLSVSRAQMVNPHGRVDQNQAGLPWRLRGAASNLGCDPPSRARRLALSRSISAFNPSLSTAERSIGPASLVALASSSSSILTVVRMF